MKNETLTFDKLPEAVGYLTEQVIELKKMVSELQPPPSELSDRTGYRIEKDGVGTPASPIRQTYLD